MPSEEVVGGRFFGLDILCRRDWLEEVTGEMGSGDPGMESDWGVLVVESLGVLGVEFIRETFGRRLLAWTSCMLVKPCCGGGARRVLDVGGTEYGQVRCRVGDVAELFRSGAAMVTLREGMFIPGDEGL